MPRFYWEWSELVDDTAWYCVCDRQQSGDDYIALCNTSYDAERIVDALNGQRPAARPAADIFG